MRETERRKEREIGRKRGQEIKKVRTKEKGRERKKQNKRTEMKTMVIKSSKMSKKKRTCFPILGSHYFIIIHFLFTSN